MTKPNDLTPDARVKREIIRLKRIYKGLPQETMQVVDGLIVQAARLRIMLDDMWADIRDNGDVELFTQSKDTDPYERERPVARLFNARDKNYQNIIKQLNDRLPESQPEDDRLLEYLAGGAK